ncbi:unnamed protein product [Schistosoma mattheei]|uniref:Uncharacterized protein n=1 Tax=Schistosoma mattheei TaxID=31246 RepID=A0A183P3Y4_9TREM|nr:unnamed protein product [Schistosoma mattheei]
MNFIENENNHHHHNTENESTRIIMKQFQILESSTANQVSY